MTSFSKEECASLTIRGLSALAPEKLSPESSTDCLHGSFTGSEDGSDNIHVSIIDQIANFNQDLERQIDTLRLRIDFNAKHHEASKESIKLSTESQIKAQQSTIHTLKTELDSKESALSQLEESNEHEKGRLSELQSQIKTMRENVEAAAAWIEGVQRDIVILEAEKRAFQTGEASENAQKEIDILQKELYTMQQNIIVMSKELHKAREIIAAQGNSIKIIETDKHQLQIKFKDDLQRLTMSVRHEIERMRDIMQNQWKEMNFLRESNQNIRQNVSEIRKLITISKSQPDPNRLNGRQYGTSSKSFPPSRNPTRGPPHPTLPLLSARRTSMNSKK